MRLVPIKEAPQGSLTPSAMCRYSETMTIYEPESMTLPDTESADTSILAFPALKL